MRIVNLRGSWSIIPAVAAAAMPKCPLCLAAFLSTIGVGVGVETRWLLPLMLAFLARRRRGYKPFSLGLGGAIFVLSGKFYFDDWALV